MNLNRAQKRRLAKPWRVRKLIRNAERQAVAEHLVPAPKRKRPRIHNGIQEAGDGRESEAR